MSVATVATIIFFAVYGIAAFWGFPYANVVLGVSALFVAGALLLGK